MVWRSVQRHDRHSRDDGRTGLGVRGWGLVRVPTPNPQPLSPEPPNVSRIVVCSLVLSLLISGCGFFRRGPVAYPGGIQEGVASWYGPGFHGKRTASGTVYNQYDMTAAHNTLPLGSRVVVTNLRNGRQVEVEVTDRGPFVNDRVIDLSFAAARTIDMIGTGTAPVRLEPAGDRPLTRVRYAVQVGAFIDRDAAHRLKQKLEDDFDNVHITTVPGEAGTYYRVRIGRFGQRTQAVDLAGDVAAEGLIAIVVEDAGAD